MVALDSRPSLRTCAELLRLRRRLPGMLAKEPIDTLVARLAMWQPSRRNLSRARLETSIAATEKVIKLLRLAEDTCLYRSMGRYAVLRANGFAVSFCMGIRPPPHRTGHAWIEDDDGPYLEEIGEGDYIVTFTHPAFA